MISHPHHQRIALVGAPGTGKSTMGHMLVAELKMAALDVEYCAEFGRSYLRRSGPPSSVFEQFMIFACFAENEDEVAIHEYVVSDSASFLGEVWYMYQRPENCSPEEEIKFELGLHELRRMCRRRLKEVDHIFFVPIAPFSAGDDPTRRYLEDQAHLSDRIRAFLDDNDAIYHVVQTTGLRERVEEVMEVLRQRGAIPAEGKQLPLS